MRDSWSVDEVLELQPCLEYCDRDRLIDLWDGRERLDVAEVAQLDIPAADRLWLLLHGDDAYVQPAIEVIVARAALPVLIRPAMPPPSVRQTSHAARVMAAAARAAASAAALMVGAAAERDRQLADVLAAWNRAVEVTDG